MSVAEDFGEKSVIELCEDCEYTVLIADLIATLGTYDKHNKPFILKIWITGSELPFEFDCSNHFDFLQEGLRVETKERIVYLFYDIISEIEVLK